MRSLMYLDRQRFGKPPLSLWGVCTMNSRRGGARQRAGNCRRLKKFPECGFQALPEVCGQNVEGHRNAAKARTGAPLTSGSPSRLQEALSPS